MSDVSSDDCGSEIGDASPEVPLPLSRREHSKVSRKKLNFEEVSQVLDMTMIGLRVKCQEVELVGLNRPSARECPARD